MADPKGAAWSRNDESHLYWRETVCDFDTRITFDRSHGIIFKTFWKCEFSRAVVDLWCGPSMTWIKNIFEVNIASSRPRSIGPQNVDFLLLPLRVYASEEEKAAEVMIGRLLRPQLPLRSQLRGNIR